MNRHSLSVILSCLLPCFLTAQICTGNLGENIFTEGDFGSGSANILQTDPGIAPGYNYDTSPPPLDGEYLITADMSLWPSAFDWLTPSDNSNDPNGYMMVVNADFSPGLFYEQQIDDLCENTLYVFSADIFNVIPPGKNYILPRVAFLLDGVEQFNTGDIPETGTWNTYGFTFVTDPGQTSVTLSLRNDAPGGIGNDLALDNITFRACGPEAFILPDEIADICEDGSPLVIDATIIGEQFDTPAVQWQQSFDEGVTWEDIPGETDLSYTHTDLSGGFYYYRYLLANGIGSLQNPKCRVVSNVKIINVIPKFYNTVDSICAGLTYTSGGSVYDATGIYTDSLLTATGCDSIVTLDLTVVPNTEIAAEFSAQGPVCVDENDGFINLDTVLAGASPFDILFDGSPRAVNFSATGLAEGSYQILISDRFGCVLDTTISIEAESPFFVELGEDLEVDLGEFITLSAETSGNSMQPFWSVPELNIDCEPDCYTVEYQPLNSAFVYFSAISDLACLAADSVFISVVKNRDIYIPNAFSPNDDGVNDNLVAFGNAAAVSAVTKFQVYDRWGNLLYNSENMLLNQPASGWDGKRNGGERAADGVYTYVAEVMFLDGTAVLLRGDVTLLR